MPRVSAAAIISTSGTVVTYHQFSKKTHARYKDMVDHFAGMISRKEHRSLYDTEKDGCIYRKVGQVYFVLVTKPEVDVFKEYDLLKPFVVTLLKLCRPCTISSVLDRELELDYAFRGFFKNKE